MCLTICAEKTYANDEDQRKQIFRTNLKKIEMHNYLHSVGLKSYTLGVNEYADMVSVTSSGWWSLAVCQGGHISLYGFMHDWAVIWSSREKSVVSVASPGE